MISSFIVNSAISLVVLTLTIHLFKKFKIRSMVIKNYENRNLHEDIKLQAVQDIYYMNKRQVNELSEEIANLKSRIHQLDKWFEEEKELLERKRTKLKRQKHEELCNKYKKEQIINYTRNSLILKCNESIQVFNQQALQYVENIEKAD